ncbi:MAG: hypothetical protein CG441_920 [Methylococcaceae bacterium NSM2-1]|nr:MAG: hypothetical protein CG441_920 [Methylococcaceae bacterium NSM2-1]
MANFSFEEPFDMDYLDIESEANKATWKRIYKGQAIIWRWMLCSLISFCIYNVIAIISQLGGLVSGKGELLFSQTNISRLNID